MANLPGPDQEKKKEDAKFYLVVGIFAIPIIGLFIYEIFFYKY